MTSQKKSAKGSDKLKDLQPRTLDAIQTTVKGGGITMDMMMEQKQMPQKDLLESSIVGSVLKAGATSQGGVVGNLKG